MFKYLKKNKALYSIIDMNVLIVGAGWAGTSVHFKLKENNINSVIFESNNFVGGHSRSDNIKGVIFEPNGPHIFHTSNTEVNEFVTKFGMLRKFNHQVKKEYIQDH